MSASPVPVGRRALLLAAVGAVAGCGASGRGASLPTGPRFVEDRFRSARMQGRAVGDAGAYPTGHGPGDRLPLVVSLHGRGSSHRTAFATLRFDDVLDGLVAEGVPPFAVASVDGGNHSYWHERADGTDAGAMVAEELVPLLARRGLGVDRLALQGWSMGGYGALLLASERSVEASAVAVSSPALFRDGGSTPAGAFDDAEDYLRHDVFSRPERLRGVPVRVDCGRQDPFHDATRDFVSRLPAGAESAFPHGSHTAAYWRSTATDALRFLGNRLG